MNVIIGFLRFWYDFIVGDAWEIALGVFIVLTLGAVLLRTNIVDHEVVPVVVTAGVWVVVGGSIMIEARRGTHAHPR